MRRSLRPPSTDPWPTFMLGHYYQILRILVGLNCGMPGKRYLRAERLLRRFWNAKEAELKRFVLTSLLDRWKADLQQRSLEQVLQDAIRELDRPSRPPA